MSFATAINLDEVKPLSFGKELKYMTYEFINPLPDDKF